LAATGAMVRMRDPVARVGTLQPLTRSSALGRVAFVTT